MLCFSSQTQTFISNDPDWQNSTWACSEPIDTPARAFSNLISLWRRPLTGALIGSLIDHHIDFEYADLPVHITTHYLNLRHSRGEN